MDLSNLSHRLGLVGVLIIIVGVAFFFMNSNSTVTKSGEAPGATKTEQNATASVTADAEPSTETTQAVTLTGALLKTNLGDIEVTFFGADAPKTVENFTKLAGAGFFTDTKFHRVIKGFMIQGGDPLSKQDSLIGQWGTGGPGYRFEDEINGNKLVRGMLAMANSGPNTNGSQFFIVTAQAAPWLDGYHTVFGKVVRGMDIVDKIENTPTGANDVPKTAVVIESIILK